MGSCKKSGVEFELLTPVDIKNATDFSQVLTPLFFLKKKNAKNVSSYVGSAATF